MFRLCVHSRCKELKLWSILLMKGLYDFPAAALETSLMSKVDRLCFYWYWFSTRMSHIRYFP